MPTKLDKPLKREIMIADQPLVLTLTPDGVLMTEKGHRKGKMFSWADLWSGEADMQRQLRASVDAMRRG